MTSRKFCKPLQRFGKILTILHFMPPGRMARSQRVCRVSPPQPARRPSSWFFGFKSACPFCGICGPDCAIYASRSRAIFRDSGRRKVSLVPAVWNGSETGLFEARSLRRNTGDAVMIRLRSAQKCRAGTTTVSSSSTSGWARLQTVLFHSDLILSSLSSCDAW